MNDNLKRWARSFSGCDGGFIKANTWLCGIEWGAGSKDDYYEYTLPLEIKNGEVKPTTNTHDWEESISYRYGVNFAKLYTAINNGNVCNYKDVVSMSGNELFKLNLYPIAFDSTDHALWKKHGIDKITGFETKHLFNTWCFFNRFPFFSNLRKIHQPKLIICTGIDYLKDFLMFFGGEESIKKLNTDTITPNSKENQHDRRYFWLKLDEDTLMIVIPFFTGRYGLNSNYLLQEMGNRIQQLIEHQNHNE